MGQRRATPRKKIKSPVWAKLAVTLGVLVTLAGFGGLVTAKSAMASLTGAMETGDTSESGATPAPVSASKALAGPINLLLLGIDTRDGWAEGSSRSDTIMILHVSATHDQAYLISIPRDVALPIPSWSRSGYAGTSAGKINSAYQHGSTRGQGWQGGAGLMQKTLTKLTGLTFNGVVVIDFAGFKNIIGVLGGVRMCVDKDTWSSHYRNVGGQPVYTPGDPSRPPKDAWWFKKGCRTMPSWEALDYARQRHGLANSDYDRQKHQQQLLRSMANKTASAGILANPIKLNQLLNAAGESLKIDTKGVPVEQFIFALKSMASSDLISLKTNGGTYAPCQYHLPDGESCEGLTAGTLRMFQAAREDRLGEFISDEPGYINSAAL
jgi:LCP family protein required for cell wall assembly